LPVLGRRTRIVVILMGVLLGLAAPVAVLNAPGLTSDEEPTGHRPADPTGLGITGALPSDPLPGNPVPGGPLPGNPVPGPVSGVAPGGGTGVVSNGVADGVPKGVPGGVLSASTDAEPPAIPIPPSLPDGPLGIPGVVLDAYQFAARSLAVSQPGCHLSWSVLAGIGKIESDHASDGRLDAGGDTLGPILGPRLDGSAGMAAIADTDHGVWDGDTVWDRAVGPMQFIPTSWRRWGVAAHGDGVANPNDIYDATLATGRYLCAGGADLSDPTQLHAAVFGYNHSATYVSIVLGWAQAYLSGVTPTPSAPGPVPPGVTGNGGRPIVATSNPPPAAALAAVTRPAPRAATTTTTTTPPPLATTTSPPPSPPLATTTSPPPSPPLATTTTPPATAPTPPAPPATTTTPLATTPTPTPPSPPTPPTTTPPATTPPPLPPPPAITTTAPVTTSNPMPPALPATTTTPPVMTSSPLSPALLSSDPPPPG
jgi:hypothetical protein